MTEEQKNVLFSKVAESVVKMIQSVPDNQKFNMELERVGAFVEVLSILEIREEFFEWLEKQDK